MFISLAVCTELNYPVKTEYFICLVSHFSAWLSNEQAGTIVLSCCSAAWHLMYSVYVSMLLTPLSHLFCSLSESFFMVKGAALFLQQGSSHQGQKAHPHHKHAGENYKAQHSESPPCYPHLSPKLYLISLLVRLLVQVTWRVCAMS